MNYQRYKLTIEYDGTDYSGWQIQPNAQTVEEELEKAFSQKLQQEIDLVGQGRTDAGVHAAGQVAHVDIPESTEIDDLIFGVNSMAGRKIQVVEWEKVAGDFHARFDALSREYEYTMTTRQSPLMDRFAWYVYQDIDTGLLEECAEMLRGEFDFAGFSRFNPDNFTTICAIEKSEWETEGHVLRYRIRANRFLRNMVRRLTGTMVRVAEGKISIEEFRNLLQNVEEERAAYTAPSKGLVLKKVFYK